MTTEHILECRWESQRCICEELRACEQRVLSLKPVGLGVLIAQRARERALDAAREAIAEQKLVPLAKRRFIITRDTKVLEQVQAWSELGWWDFRTSALAAIDALREEEK